MSIDPQFVELTADVVRIIYNAIAVRFRALQTEFHASRAQSDKIKG